MYCSTDDALERAAAVETDHIELIDETRSRLLTHLSGAVKALRQAAGSLDELRSDAVYDVEFVEGRDGRDIAALLDDSIRLTRAAYAVVHTVIDQQTP